MLADENRRRETLPPFGATEHEPLGRRLVPKLIDERAEREPTKIFSSIPISDDLTDGYHDITYATLARAIDRAAWWLHDATGQSPKGCKFASLGPNDLRYVIFVVAAMKCRYQVSHVHKRWDSQKSNMQLDPSTVATKYGRIPATAVQTSRMYQCDLCDFVVAKDAGNAW